MSQQWAIEHMERGYRPILDGKWRMLPERYATEREAKNQVKRLYRQGDEYQAYRVVEVAAHQSGERIDQ